MCAEGTIALTPICQRGEKQGADCPCAGVPEVRPLFSENGVATVAYELRGPLATILLALEAMADRDEVNFAVLRAREVVRRQVLRAVRIVDDLFDVCAGSHGTLSINNEVVEGAEDVAASSKGLIPATSAAFGARLASAARWITSTLAKRDTSFA